MVPTLLVTFEIGSRGRAVVEEAVGAAGRVIWLADMDDGGRAAALAAADVLLSRNTTAELKPGELALPRRARLLQFMSAGIDFIPLDGLPAGIGRAACRERVCQDVSFSVVA